MTRRRKWACLSVKRVFHKIHDTEMRQRLAEVVDTLLSKKSQLQKVPAFSKDRTSLRRPSLRKPKRRDSA